MLTLFIAIISSGYDSGRQSIITILLKAQHYYAPFYCLYTLSVDVPYMYAKGQIEIEQILSETCTA